MFVVNGVCIVRRKWWCTAETVWCPVENIKYTHPAIRLHASLSAILMSRSLRNSIFFSFKTTNYHWFCFVIVTILTNRLTTVAGDLALFVTTEIQTREETKRKDCGPTGATVGWPTIMHKQNDLVIPTLRQSPVIDSESWLNFRSK